MSRTTSQTFWAALSLACFGIAACSAVFTSNNPTGNPATPDSKSPAQTQVSGPTIPLASLTANNTAACPASGALPAWCQHTWAGQTDTRTGILTPVFDARAGNVSTEDIHGYLANGAKTKVFANFMLGFCISTASAYCSNNVQTGYISNSAATVAAQSADLINRHFDGADLSWDGAGTSADSASLLFQSWADQNACSGSTCKLTYLIMYNFASMSYNVKSTGIPGTSGASCSGLSGSSYESCVIAHVRNDMCYMNGKHWGSTSYQKFNGRPVLQIFPDEKVIPLTGPAPSWADVWTHIESWNSNLPQNCGVAPYNANNGVPLVVFENVGGFTHQDSSGSFYWVNPAGTSLSTDQLIFNIGPQGTGGTLDTFLADSLSYSNDRVWSTAFKGFNSIQAHWGTGRIMDQQCGKTWIRSLTESNSYYSGGLPWLKVATWNDYNEGTEIESGIDNCYTVIAGVSGNSLKWQLHAASSYAGLSTVSHLEIYDSPDGQNLTLLGKQSAAASGTYSLNTLSAGTHTLFVRMVGKNSVLNRMSSGVTYKN